MEGGLAARAVAYAIGWAVAARQFLHAIGGWLAQRLAQGPRLSTEVPQGHTVGLQAANASQFAQRRTQLAQL